jgi:hypothetical protein
MCGTGVPEEPLHDVLGDALHVDQPGPEGMTELMTGHRDGLPGLVAQVDDALPAHELPTEGAVRVRPWTPSSLPAHPGEQPRAARRPEALST